MYKYINMWQFLDPELCQFTKSTLQLSDWPGYEFANWSCFDGNSLSCSVIAQLQCAFDSFNWFNLFNFKRFLINFSCAQLDSKCEEALWTSSGRTFLFLSSSANRVSSTCLSTWAYNKFTFIWLIWVSIEHIIKMFCNNCRYISRKCFAPIEVRV